MFKTIGQFLATRNKEIHTQQYRMRLALRDEPDYSNDLPEEPRITEVIHRTSNMSSKDFRALEQVILKVDYLEKKLNEKKPTNKHFETYT